MAISNAVDYYRDLVKSGVPDDQAYNQTKALEKVLDNLATKEDLNNAFNILNTKIEHLNSTLNAKIDHFNDTLNAKIDSVNNTLSAKIDGVSGEIGMMQKWEIAMLALILGAVLKVAFWG